MQHSTATETQNNATFTKMVKYSVVEMKALCWSRTAAGTQAAAARQLHIMPRFSLTRLLVHGGVLMGLGAVLPLVTPSDGALLCDVRLARPRSSRPHKYVCRLPGDKGSAEI
jgi:hypothetical protein